MKLWRSFYIKHTHAVYTVPSFYNSPTTRNEINKYNHIKIKLIINVRTYVYV